MVIPWLSLKDFRNYQDFEISFSEGVQLIYGANGQGKTNLVESIYLATHLRSYRAARLKPLIKQGSERALIDLKFSDHAVNHQVRLELWPQAKRVFLDQKPLQLSSEYIQKFFSILFAPDQLSRFKEYPAERRGFFDRALCLLEPGYFSELKEFERVKAQKNKLLKDKRFEELDLFNQLMAPTLPALVKARQKLVDALNQILPEVHQRFVKSAEPLRLEYRPDLAVSDPQEAYESIAAKAHQETAQGHCVTGPHRDNYLMTMGPKMDRMGFSQGEYRIAFLALLFGLNSLFYKQLNSRPLLLLDDLFSELDQTVSQALVELLGELKNQVFITSTFVPQGMKEHVATYLIENATLGPNLTHAK